MVAALLDAGSGMLLTSRSRDGAPEDLETVCAGQADVIRAALDAARISIGGPEPTEVVVAHGDRLHQLLRTVHDPLGDRLVLSLLVEGPPRALRRVRRRLGRIDTATLVPLPLRGPAAPPPGADLFTPAQSGAQGPWWAGDGVRAEPPAGAPPPGWNAAVPGAPGGVGPAAPVGPVAPVGPGGAVAAVPGGFTPEVIDSAIEATVRIAARTPAAPEHAASTPAAAQAGETRAAAQAGEMRAAAQAGETPAAAQAVETPVAAQSGETPGPAEKPAPVDAEPVTTALPLAQTRTPEPVAAGPHPITASLGSNPAALPARPAAPAAPAVAAPQPASAAAVPTPTPTPTPAAPATPVAMPAVPARPVEPAPPVPSPPTAMPVSGRAAGWSTASVLGHGAGPGGAATATDVVEALDDVATDDSLSGSALFTGVVPAQPAPSADDPAAPLTRDSAPPVDGPEPHPWFGGRHAAPDGTAPAAAGHGPGRHTSTGATRAAAVAQPTRVPGWPAAALGQPLVAQPFAVPGPRAAETAGSLFEPACRTETDASAVPGHVDSTPVGLGEDRDAAGRDGGNRADPGR
ncbi:hypothetical protein ACFFOU_28595 [Pseudonocardia sulfidoxydans]|uniref:hypothetical protein n=1 Tax=Pseudonocardia sulfidoxydans TaxID=54011 RepID=UPI0011BF68C0|nr:hypothetical protein [Pseudonocardia sulfidoxydans]